MLVNDGVIQTTERNAYIGPDGLLNPDGKRVVEEALRGRVARSYEALASLPGPVVAKIDAAIPHLLVAESIGKGWNITRHMRDAIDLLAEFRASSEKYPRVFLDQTNMLMDGTPRERFSQPARVLFQAALDMKKGDFAEMFARFAGQATISAEAGGIPGVSLTAEQAAKKYLGFETQARKQQVDTAGKGKPQAPAKAIRADGTKLGVPDGAPLKEYQRAAREIYREMQKTPAHRKDLGDIQFTGAGFGEMKKTGFDVKKWKLVPYLREIVEKAEHKKRVPLKNARKDKIVAFHWLEADVELDGAPLRVGVNIAEDAAGNKFYNMNEEIGAWREKYEAPDNRSGQLPPEAQELLQDGEPSAGLNISISDADVKPAATGDDKGGGTDDSLHKSLHRTKEKPYPGLPRIRPMSVGGVSTISHAGEPTPGGSLSARDASSVGETGQNVKPAGNTIAKVDENSTEEIREQQQRIRDWLAQENLEKAKGKTREEIFREFDNTPQPVAWLPSGYLQHFTGKTNDNRIYSGQAYFLDHAVNSHRDIPVEAYENIQDHYCPGKASGNRLFS